MTRPRGTAWCHKESITQQDQEAVEKIADLVPIV